MDRSDRFSLPYVIAAQAQKHVTVNETTRALDALVHMSVRARNVSEQPGAPEVGEGYIIPEGQTGTVWETFSTDDVSIFQDNAWERYSPTVGMTVYIEAEQAHVVWSGTAWEGVASGAVASAPQFGVNSDADATNKLAVKSDAVLFSHDDVTPGTGDIRTIVNKQAAANTASVIFQTNFSGRAEFGLTGSDDFAVKVSPDGTNFFDAIVIDRATGAVSFPNTPDLTGGGTPPFSPLDIDGLIGWWDPSDATTVTLDGATISSIADKSGLGHDAIQQSQSEQPSLVASGVGGRDVMGFNGDQYIDISDIAPQISGEDTPFSVHFVFQASQTADTQIAFGGGSSTSGTTGFWFGVFNGGEFRTAKRVGTSVNHDATLTDLLPHFVSIVHTGTTTDIWIDGVRVVKDGAHDVPEMVLDRVALGAWVRSSSGFHFEGSIGEVLVYETALNDDAIRTVHRYLGERWFGIPTGTDLFLAIGQSNMMGTGDASQSPSVAPGIGFELSNAGLFHSMDDPVGPANTGCCLPAFANSWHAATGRGAFVVNNAVGSTGLVPAADQGLGNWDKAAGALYSPAVANANAAFSTISTDSIYDIEGVYVLWAQGEREAAAISSGTPGVSGAVYETALTDLVDHLATDLNSGLSGFFIFELGARDDGNFDAEWAEVRAAQNAAAASNSLAHVVFTGAKDFPGLGLMADNLHYTQPGYNQMGTDGATNAAATVA